MTDDDTTCTDVHVAPIDAFSQAVVRYSAEGNAVVFEATNESFSATFVTDTDTPTFRRWWRENELAAPGSGADVIDASLAAGDAFETTVRTEDGAAYQLRVVPDDDSTTGTLTLTELADGTDTRPVGDHIAGVVSHDLRNPLDVAKARARAARETGDTEHFDRLDRAHDRMERIIGDVLTLARGNGVVDTTAGVAVARVAREAWQAVETGAVSLSLAPDLPETEADADRLQRLFENLFRNAVEHGSTGPGSRTHQDTAGHGSAGDRTPSDDAEGDESTANRSQSDAGSEHGDAVTVRVGPAGDGFFVADDGRGIPPGEQDRIFEPGYTATGDGTGLGLTIVDRIATAHGWTVTTTESRAGGARFEVTGLA
jgi:signal transduction histidine kinase